MSGEAHLKKDRNCRKCEYLFDCKGKPPGVDLCIRFKERKKYGRDHKGLQ